MHEDNCAVYVHVNLINGKKYFGITVTAGGFHWRYIDEEVDDDGNY